MRRRRRRPLPSRRTAEWTVTASNLDWATISPMSGKGNGTISVTVSELPAGTNLREGKISFTLIHPEFGKWGQSRVVRSRETVRQRGYTPPRAMLSMLTISIRSRLKRGQMVSSPSQMHSRAGRIRLVRVPTMLLIKRAV
ncbi:MAG: BACON domain-containing protein [Alistipes onderdonkii]